MSESKKARMLELVEKLNDAGRAYYQESREIMSNREYDALYDELKGLEGELGITFANSPTVNVGYEVLSELPKERHESPMLSLDKTKEVEELKKFLGEQKALLSWKLDGLTIVLTYRGGELFKAVTRGNGEVGEVITNNARVFRNAKDFLQVGFAGHFRRAVRALGQGDKVVGPRLVGAGDAGGLPQGGNARQQGDELIPAAGPASVGVQLSEVRLQRPDRLGQSGVVGVEVD